MVWGENVLGALPQPHTQNVLSPRNLAALPSHHPCSPLSVDIGTFRPPAHTGIQLPWHTHCLPQVSLLWSSSCTETIMLQAPCQHWCPLHTHTTAAQSPA